MGVGRLVEREVSEKLFISLSFARFLATRPPPPQRPLPRRIGSRRGLLNDARSGAETKDEGHRAVEAVFGGH